MKKRYGSVKINRSSENPVTAHIRSRYQENKFVVPKRL